MAKTIEDAIAALEKKTASTKPGTSDKRPQTGDTSNLALWIALLFISGGAAIGTTIVSRKKKYNRLLNSVPLLHLPSKTKAS